MRRKPKNRETKFHLIFDEEERKEYLTGFQKRKKERKTRAREQLERQLKEEKKRLKEKQKELIKTMFHSQRGVPEVEHLVEPVTYELPEHFVTVTPLSDIDIAGQSGIMLGKNKPTLQNEEKQDSDNEMSAEARKKLKQKLKNERIKAMKTSKAFKVKKQMQRKKDKQSARRKKFNRKVQKKR